MVSLRLAYRVVLLGVIFSVELLLRPVSGRMGLAVSWMPAALPAVVAAAFLFAAFSWLRKDPEILSLGREIQEQPVSLALLGIHFVLFTAFFSLSSSALANQSATAYVVLWAATGFLSAGCAACAFIPPHFWISILKSGRILWLLVSGAAAITYAIKTDSEKLWPFAVSWTFALSRIFVSVFSSHVVVDTPNRIIGTPRFQVTVLPSCAGLEGIGLVFAFGVIWLFIFRKEIRFPHALLLLPVSVVLSFVLNSLRIALLIWIGNTGATEIAMYGFHSQAGWIAFNITALAFAVAAKKLSWVSAAGPVVEAAEPARENVTVRWLLPFVVLLAAQIVSASLNGGFEWAYPVRVISVVCVLAALFPTYRQMNWRFGWQGIGAGVLVFLTWIAFDRPASSQFKGMPAALAAASPLLRTVWIAFRALGATITVPVAEELAFRGYLYRRLISAEFETVPFRRYSAVALAISSLMFGICHGGNWLLAVFAGLVYTLVMLRWGKIGDAIAAHATTNALLAAYVLIFNRWGLW